MRKKKLFIPLTIIIISIPLILSASLPAPAHAASLTLNPASGSAGSIVQISGKGFVGRLATIHWDDRWEFNDIMPSNC